MKTQPHNPQFDNFISRTLKDMEADYHPNDWNEMEAMLGPAPTKISGEKMKYPLVAAGALVIIVGGFFLIKYFGDAINSSEPSSPNQTTAMQLAPPDTHSVTTVVKAETKADTTFIKKDSSLVAATLPDTAKKLSAKTDITQTIKTETKKTEKKIQPVETIAVKKDSIPVKKEEKIIAPPDTSKKLQPEIKKETNIAPADTTKTETKKSKKKKDRKKKNSDSTQVKTETPPAKKDSVK